MALFYSRLENGFFDDRMGILPVDAVPVTDAEHEALMLAQSQGKRIQADSTGHPVAVTPLPTTAQVIAARKATALDLLDKSDKTLLRCIENGVTFPVAWRLFRLALRNNVNGSSNTLPTQPDFPVGS